MSGGVTQLGRMWALAAYRPVLYTVDLVFWSLIHLAPIVPGLIAKEFFDTLTGDGRLGLDVWGLVAVLLSFAGGRIAVLYGGFRADILLRFSISSLLRRNVIARLLERPGALPPPRPAGEVISNLREDVQQIENSVDWVIDVAGTKSLA